MVNYSEIRMMGMQTKTDLRIIKTRANIRTSFIELLLEKDFNEITIQNILDQALINRSTFYNHYSDKYDLVEQLITELMKNFALFLNERFSYMKDEELISTLYKTYEYLYDQKKTILALWKIKTTSLHLYDDCENLLKENFMQYLATNNICKDNSLSDYYSTIYASLVLTTIKWLLTSGKESDIKKILEQVQDTLIGKIFSTE